MLRKILPALFGRADETPTAAPPVKKWASAYASDRFYCLVTHSGYRSSAIDTGGENILLSPDCSDEELGVALLRSLAASRMVPLDELGSFFDVSAVMARHETWVNGLMRHQELKTRKALFTGMNNCSVEQQDGVITILPMARHGKEGWQRTTSMALPTINVSANEGSREVGAALRQAFSHCQ